MLVRRYERDVVGEDNRREVENETLVFLGIIAMWMHLRREVNCICQRHAGNV